MGVGPTDRLETLDVHLIAHAGETHERTDAGVPGLAAEQVAALAPGVGRRFLGRLCAEGEVLSRRVERPRAAHVHRAGGTALDHGGRGALVHGELGEQLGREHVEVDFPIGVLCIGPAGRCDRDRCIVQQNAGEIGAEAANRDVQAFAIDLTADRDARNAVERLGDVGVGKLAEVLGEDRVLEPGGRLLGVGRLLEAQAIAGDDDLLQVRAACRRGRLGAHVLRKDRRSRASRDARQPEPNKTSVSDEE